MAKIKYMGLADVRLLERGEDWSGRLADPLTSDLVFDRSNNWIVDTGEAGLSDEAVALLLEDSEFKDVSSLKRIPANQHQRTFLGFPAHEDAEDVLDEAPEPTSASSEKADSSQAGSVSEVKDSPTTGGTRRRGGGAS